MTPVVDAPLPAVKLKSANALVPPLSFVMVLVTRRVPYWTPGVTMQSNGLLLPPLPADGYEQTLASFAPARTRCVLLIDRSIDGRVVGPVLVAPTFANGSVSVMRLLGPAGERSEADRPTVPAGDLSRCVVYWSDPGLRAAIVLRVAAVEQMYGDGPSSRRGFGASTGLASGILDRERRRRSRCPRPRRSCRRARTRRPSARSVQALIESQLQKMRMLGFADVSRPIWVTSTWPGTSFAPWTSTWVPPV